MAAVKRCVFINFTSLMSHDTRYNVRMYCKINKQTDFGMGYFKISLGRGWGGGGGANAKYRN